MRSASFFFRLIVLASFALAAGSCGLLTELTMPQKAYICYVAKNGRDDQPGTFDKPFATLQRARDEIRKRRAAGALSEGATVYVRGGTYTLSETFKLGPEDSGTPEGPINYRACKGESVVFVGGREITGFMPYRGQILKADVAAQGLKGTYFRQLFFDGKRMRLARYPNFDPQNPYGGGWAYADGAPIPMYQDIPNESRRTLHYKKEDARTWARPTDGEVFVFPRYNWWNNIVRIASIDSEKRLMTLTADCSYPIRPGDRYYVQNLFEELDAPGEWYLDRETWTLYFWPPAPLEGKTVYAPTLRTIFELQKGAAHVNICGFTIECCEGTAITLKETSNCFITGNTIRNVGDYTGSGVTVDGGSNNGVVGNDIYEVGRNGISLSGGDRITLTPAGNYADNNYIHHTGVFYKQGVGISLSGCGNIASHNLIHDCPRFGILFSGNDLVIEYNHIRHVNLETADTGAVYTGGRDWISSRGTVIRYNFFHDSLGYGMEDGKWVSPHYAWGIYLDDNTGGVDVIGNIVARAIRGPIHLHNGRDNLVENNIFVDGKLQQIECNGWTETHRFWTSHLETMIKGYESVVNQPAWKEKRNMHIHPTKAVLPNGLIMTGNVFRRNILYYHDPQAKAFSFRNVPFDHNESDYNLIYHFGHPILTGQFQIKEVVGPNLAPNPNFEGGKSNELPPGWRWQIRPGGTAKAGVEGKALRIEGATGKDAKGKPQHPEIVSTEIPARLGQAYKITARLKAQNPGAKVSFGVQSYVANVYFWSKQTPLTVGTDWTECEVAFKFPAPTDANYKPEMKTLVVRIDLLAETGVLWVSDVCLKEAIALDEWESWKALGMDRHSLVADPLFVDPDKDDYRLRPESPAFRLGFKPIPVEKIGPYPSALRASWPIVEAEGVREKPLVSQSEKP